MTDNLNTKETWDYLNEKVFKNPMIQWEEFMQIFSSRMFKNALIKIINRISGTDDYDSLVLKIS